MRIVSGTHRGRKLFAPSTDTDTIRPTSDRVKEALFDILQHDIEGRRVLDLFAGSGQLGIEALSRGAASVTFVDENSDAIRLIKRNVALLDNSTQSEGCARLSYNIVQSEALSYLRTSQKYHIVLLDPPYQTNLLKKCLDTIISLDKLENCGIIVCECPAPMYDIDGFTLKHYKYGKTWLSTYRGVQNLELRVQN